MDLKEEYEKLLRYCYMKTGDRLLAEDITQEAFLKFWNAHSYSDTGKELAYLYTIAKNLCVSEFRKQRVTCIDPGVDISERESLEAAAMEDVLVDSVVIRDAMKRLPEDTREMVLLRYVNEMTVTEIGKIMGISRFAVHRKLKSGIARLRQILGKGGTYYG